jgi:hypothetical protein
MTTINGHIEQINALLQAYISAKEDYQHCILLLDALFERQIREKMLFGIFLLQKFKRAFTDALFEHINHWIQWIENWEVCDQLSSVACFVVAKNHTSLSHCNSGLCRLTCGADVSFWPRRVRLIIMNLTTSMRCWLCVKI